MVRAHEIAAVLGKKLIIDPIQGNADVATLIQIGEMFAFEVNEHGLKIVFAAGEHKFFALAVAQLAHSADEFLSLTFVIRWCSSHERLFSQKRNVAAGATN